jgi:hypothetical protein
MNSGFKCNKMDGRNARCAEIMRHAAICVSVIWMAKLEGNQRGHYDWLVDPPTTGGNPKLKYFFSTFGMSLSSPISLTVFIFLLQVTTQPAYPYWK